MNPTIALLEQQREQVLEQMRSIDRMCRGTLSRHFLKRKRDGKTLTFGPYFVLQGCLRGKKVEEHVPAAEAEKVGQYADNYKRFQELADRFVTVTDQMTRLADGKEESKKNSRRRKSPTNASGKPKAS